MRRTEAPLRDDDGDPEAGFLVIGFAMALVDLTVILAVVVYFFR
jgi:hypothetical protein